MKPLSLVILAGLAMHYCSVAVKLQNDACLALLIAIAIIFIRTRKSLNDNNCIVIQHDRREKSCTIKVTKPSTK